MNSLGMKNVLTAVGVHARTCFLFVVVVGVGGAPDK
jgi:hypothetical protein